MTTALATIETLTPAIVFAPGGVEGIISKLETEVRAIPRDMSTDQGRDAIRALAYKVARSKTALDEMGKDLVTEIKKQSGAIDAERRIIRDRLDALRDEVRGPLTVWEEAEKKRVADHEAALVAIITSANFTYTPSADAVRNQLTTVKLFRGRPWEEFSERAETALSDAETKLDAMLAETVQREADAAELAELRRLKAERDAVDQAAAEAKAHAAREAQAAEARAVREQEIAAQAKRDQEAAAAKAVEDERARVAAEKAAEAAATAKREANKKHRAKVHTAISSALALIVGEHSDAAGPAAVAAAEAIVDAIELGNIPHVSITY